MAYRASAAAAEAAALAAPTVPAEDVLAILDAGGAVAIADTLRHLSADPAFFPVRHKLLHRADGFSNGGVG